MERLTKQEIIVNIDDLIEKLKYVSSEIEFLKSEKSKLESDIINIVSFNPEGQKTIETAKYKIRVNAGYNYKIDSLRAEEFFSQFPANLNPIKQKISYEVDKNKLNQAYLYEGLKELADQVIAVIPKPIRVEVL